MRYARYFLLIFAFFILGSSFFILSSSLHAYIFKPEIIDGKEYISLNDVCDLYGLSFRHKFFPGKILLIGEKGETVVLLIHSNRFRVRNKIYILDSPLKMKKGVVFVPVEFVGKAFGERVLKDLKKKQAKVLKKKKLKIKTIVIDAGHGGRDPGAVGPNGLMEKEVNLEVSRKLKQLLNAYLPVEVLMTRDRDVFVPLGDRAKFANKKGAQLFVSIHCNAAFSRATHGCETYYVSETDDPEARAVEVLENSVIKLEMKELGVSGKGMLGAILEDMIYHEYVHKSIPLAAAVQKKMSRGLRLEDRGVKHALFYVLRGVAAPSILVEIAFLSNVKEEAKLASKSFRDRAAEAIFQGIAEYILAEEK